MMKRLLALGTILAGSYFAFACTSILGATDLPPVSDGGDDSTSGSSSGMIDAASEGVGELEPLLSGATDGSSSGGDAGCSISWQNKSCESCFQANCLSACQTCTADMACNAFFSCRAGCGSNDACIEGCFTTLDKVGGQSLSDEESLLSDPTGCVYKSCRSECTTPANIGDPCVVNADCSSMTCVPAKVGWCSTTCTDNASCGKNSSGTPSYCVKIKGGGSQSCFPGCPNGQSDCNNFECSSGKAPTCQSASSAADGGSTSWLAAAEAARRRPTPSSERAATVPAHASLPPSPQGRIGAGVACCAMKRTKLGPTGPSVPRRPRLQGMSWASASTRPGASSDGGGGEAAG